MTHIGIFSKQKINSNSIKKLFINNPREYLMWYKKTLWLVISEKVQNKLASKKSGFRDKYILSDYVFMVMTMKSYIQMLAI